MLNFGFQKMPLLIFRPAPPLCSSLKWFKLKGNQTINKFHFKRSMKGNLYGWVFDHSIRFCFQIRLSQLNLHLLPKIFELNSNYYNNNKKNSNLNIRIEIYYLVFDKNYQTKMDLVFVEKIWSLLLA